MVNINDCQPMTDHFDGIDQLVKEAPHTEGAPNFRRVRENFHQVLNLESKNPKFLADYLHSEINVQDNEFEIVLLVKPQNC